MITTDMRMHAPQTIEELIQQKYPIYTIPQDLGSTKPSNYVVEWFKNYDG